MSRDRNFWIGCGAILLVSVCGVFLLGGGIGVYRLLRTQNPEPLALHLRINPSTVPTGQTFNLQITIANEGSRTARISRLRLPNNLLQGAVITSVSPLEISRDGATDLVFDLAVDPGSSETISIMLQGQVPGDYAGSLEIEAGDQRQAAQARVVIIDAAALIQVTPTPTLEPTPTLTPGPPLGAIPFPAVVEIFAMVQGDNRLEDGWNGSGSIISPDGLILTNAHVVLPDKYYDVKQLQIGITVGDDKPPVRRYIAEVIQADPRLDIAVIRISSDLAGHPVDSSTLDLPYVPLGNSDTLSLGDSLTILGYPGIGGETITLTRGEVSGFTSELGRAGRAFIKTSATIAGGNSGGLAADPAGRLIGVPTELGYGGEQEFVDCRVLADTNRDGVIDDQDSCVPTGGFINALRPISLAVPLIEAAQRGEVMIGAQHFEEAQIPTDGEILFEDNFSNSSSGWDIGNNGSSRRSYKNGTYHIEVIPDNYYSWSNPGQNFEDVVITVDTRAAVSTGTGDFGVICRYQDEDNFYALEVSEDGYYAIWKAQDGDFKNLLDWTYSNQIPQSKPVSLTVSCIGDRLTLAAGNTLLAEVSDDSISTGDVGLIAGTWDDGNFEMEFDNFVVRAP
jgi:S1-C subfamily serine protease